MLSKWNGCIKTEEWKCKTVELVYIWFLYLRDEIIECEFMFRLQDEIILLFFYITIYQITVWIT